jgi:hypothetical protein
VEHYLSPFWLKDVEENVVKSLIILKVQSPENLTKKLPTFIVEIL